MSEEDIDLVLDVDLKGALTCAQLAIPALRARGGGSIVFVTSVQAYATLRGCVVYGAAKAGLVAAARALAIEVGEHRIRVNAIAPGTIDTPMLSRDLEGMNAEDAENFLDRVRAANALGRIGTVAEIGDVLVFLRVRRRPLRDRHDDRRRRRLPRREELLTCFASPRSCSSRRRRPSGRSSARSGSRRPSACSRGRRRTGARTRPRRRGDTGRSPCSSEEVEDAGLRLTVIEDNPPMDRLRLGLPGREEELENVLELVRNDGEARDRGALLQLDGRRPLVADVDRAPRPRRRDGDRLRPLRLGGRPSLRRARRSRRNGSGRRSPGSSSVSFPSPRRPGSGSRLHPDDPPLSPLRGIARIVRSLDAYDRVFELQPSPANGMTMCQGNVALMTDDLPGAIRRFGVAAADPLRPLPRRPGNAASASSRRSSTKARRTWPRASAPTSTWVSTLRSARTTRRPSPGTTGASPAIRRSAAPRRRLRPGADRGRARLAGPTPLSLIERRRVRVERRLASQVGVQHVRPGRDPPVADEVDQRRH